MSVKFAPYWGCGFTHMYTFKSLAEGTHTTAEYVISTSVYENFLRAFDDTSRIHVDEAYARSRGFKGLVMHGAILNGFVSHFVGMRVAGENGFLQSVDIQYKNPNYLGDAIAVDAEVIQKVEAVNVAVMKLVLRNTTQGTTAATANIRIGFFV